MISIPFLKPNLVKAEAYIQYLNQIDNSRWYSNYGPLNSLFEGRVIREYFDSQGAAVTVNNATIGLMVSIMNSKREKARYAIMPSFTFAATPLAAQWCGLEPYFIDVRPDNWCMDEALVEDVLQKVGDQVAIIVPYATFGTGMSLEYYRNLYLRGFPVVVDAAASFGAIEERIHFGQGFPGPIVFSFHATKAFGIGEGGLVYCGDGETIATIRRLGNFGFESNRESTQMGLNSKMAEYTAAIALSTLNVFQEKTQKRQQIFEWYIDEFNNWKLFAKGWEIQSIRGKVPFQFFSSLCPSDELNVDYIQKLQRNRIEARTYFSPACHQQKQFRECPRTDLTVTECLSRRVLSLPLWEEMQRDQVEEVAKVLCS